MFLYIFSFFALVISLIACVATKINLIRKNNRGQKMAIAKDFLWLTGIVGGILFMGLAVFSYIKSGITITGYLLLLFVWFGLFLVYGWFGMITLYDEESFTCGWLPLQRKRYTYEQLTGKKRTLNGYKLFVVFQ